MNIDSNYIGLIDCNNFFASCERIFEPSFRERPIGVVSNKEGCFVARSNELKALGVPMGASYYQIRDIIKKNKVIVKTANFSLYSDISKRIMKVLKKNFPRVEIYSVDEAFIYFTSNSPQKIHEEGLLIRYKLFKWIGIPVSVGIATTKTLAKVACKISKLNSHLNGVCLLNTQDKIHNALKSIDASDIWGIGRKRSKFLKTRGIHSAYDFSQLSEDWVQKNLSISGLYTLLEIKGLQCFSFEETVRNNKSILRSRSFRKPITALADLSEAVAYHTTRAAEVLRSQHAATSTIGVFIRTNRFSNTPQYSESSVEYLLEPTDYTPDLLKSARIALEKIYKRGYRYTKAGIYFPEVIPSQGAQRDLFKSDKNPISNQRLMNVMDRLTDQYGPQSLFYASLGTKPLWHHPKTDSSPRYTTHWNELKECF